MGKVRRVLDLTVSCGLWGYLTLSGHRGTIITLRTAEREACPKLHCLHTLGCIFHYLKVTFKEVFVDMMDASQRTSSCIFPAGKPSAGHICLCHEKFCFHQPLQLISIPDTVNAFQKTESPRTLLESLLTSSIPCWA